ncbi:glycoside hydrolase family 3 N-terminal domain-containing protein [Novosphingopyxis sp.]|uniref:glycoside hydrolase family 3 N-terminal domain-containing protein n=1 Tax=Novosphingopyxis sp. TaxID=2709690 RepID=UPI003B5984AF
MSSYRLAAALAASTVLLSPLAYPAPVFAQSAEAAPQRPPADAPYRNAGLTDEARIDDLIARMTLGEKIAQITSMWDNKKEIFDDADEFDIAKARAKFPDGIGQFARPSDATGPGSPRETPGRDAAATVRLVNALQHWATQDTRLGIPIIFHEEGLHGYAALGATSFPQSIAMASSWDPDLLRQVNAVIAREIRARGVSLALSPVVDVARDPRWGRIEETFGEDPYLVSELGVAAVEGLQGTGTETRRLAPGKVLATLKHMTGHGQPENGTNVGPAQISERILREDFFPPFEQVVKRTGIDAVMASYNEIDGVPSHANKWLLHDILRGEWGYRGAVVSDYYAIAELASRHHIAEDAAGAAKYALAAGVDSDLPNGAAYDTLVEAVRDGSVAETAIDQAVRHMLAMKFKAGLFEQPFARLADTEVANNAEAIALARKMAEKSLVLLKNDGMLPLAMPKAGGRKPTIAAIGPNAAVARLGGYYGQPPKTVSPLEGIKALVGNRADIVYSEGVRITVDDDWWQDKVELADPEANRRMIAEAAAAARGADQILLFIGDTEQTSREGWGDEHLGDRTQLDLVGQQQELFDALKALGKPITAVLINGRPPSYVGIAEHANAVLETWYGGEQQGNAIADALFGKVNPGGKLPVSVARSSGQLPIYYNYKPTARRGYLFDTTAPLYPFGYGLSYTRFTLGEPKLSAGSIVAGQPVDVSVTVTNSGEREGDEVVQIYVRDKVSSVTRPVKELKAFRRITLKPGETRTVTLPLGPEAFRFWNIDMKRVIEPGEFEIMAGDNSANLKTVTLTITP